jgi:beta-barrel assembly-enhancing protease
MDKDEVRNWVLFGGLSIAFTLACVGLLLGPGLRLAVDKAVDRLPPKLEDELGAKLLGQLFEKQASKDPALKAVLQACAEKLPLEGEQRKYTVLLIEDKTLNAFALPGGHLILHRGLLDSLQDQSELFFVLGHEAGHVQGRHFLKRLAHSAGIGLALAVLLGDPSGMAAVLAEGGQELLQRGYGRKEEEASDDAGLATLRRLGLDPLGASRAMQRLMDAGGSSAVPEFLSTHPDTAKRKARLEAAAGSGSAALGGAVLSDEQWSILKRAPKGAGTKEEKQP